MMKYLATNRYVRAISAVLSAACGVAILHSYLFYLNKFHKALRPKPDHMLWMDMKMFIFMGWFTLVLGCLCLCRSRLAAKGYAVSDTVLRRCIWAGGLFIVSVTGFAPPIIELTAFFFLNTVAYLMVLYAVFSVLPERWTNGLGRSALQLLRQDSLYWVGMAFLFMFGVADYLSLVLFEHFPWIDDTIVQFVHAKFLARGHWYGISKPLYQFFDMTMMVNDGKWYSQYPPGHVLMLTVGMVLHHPEIVNPFMGACTCVGIWALAKELYGRHVGRIAVFLAALCMYIVVVSSEYMNSATSLMMSVWFLWGYFRVLHRPAYWPAAVGGVALGWCFITRPYSAFGICLPAAIYALRVILSKPRQYMGPMATMAAMFGCLAAFQLYYNSVTTGKAFAYGYTKLQGDRDIPFSLTCLSNLTPSQLLDNLIFNLERLNYFNRMLFEWPVPALALVALVFCLRGNRRDEKLLFATLAFMFFSIQVILNFDYGWGPRLAYEITGILVVLSAKAISMLPPLLRKLSSRRRPLSFYYGSGLVILASFYVFSFQYNLKPSIIKKEYMLEYREGNPEFYKSILRQVDPPALVFVPKNRYMFVSSSNPPDDTNPVIFAQDRGKQNDKLIGYYPKRRIYFVDDVGSETEIIYSPDASVY